MTDRAAAATRGIPNQSAQAALKRRGKVAVSPEPNGFQTNRLKQALKLTAVLLPLVQR